jgi:hypothetical protein
MTESGLAGGADCHLTQRVLLLVVIGCSIGILSSFTFNMNPSLRCENSEYFELPEKEAQMKYMKKRT